MEQSIVDRVYAAQGNSVAADALIRDYIPFIRAEASKATGKIIDAERDDEFSIAMIGFHEAVETYSKFKGAFLTYASVVMRRKLIDYYRKEKRHLGQISLDVSKNEDGPSIGEELADSGNEFDDLEIRDATKREILELTAQMRAFGLSLSDVSDNCPKQERTLLSCQKAIKYAKDNPALIQDMLRTQRLPIAKLSQGSGVERKTLERHRKYLLALLLIYSNGYEIIRGHLKQIFKRTERGAGM